MNEATAALRADLMSADPSVQILAARRCARAKPPELVDDLIELGRSPDAEVRAAAWWALDQMRATAAIPQLVEGLADPDFGARSNAGWALVHIGPAVLPYVAATAAHSSNADAREMAGLVLAHLKCEGRTLLGAPPVAYTSILRREFGGVMNAINTELSVVAGCVTEITAILPRDVDAEVRATVDELGEFRERLCVSSAALNHVMLNFARAEYVDEVARLEVLARTRTLGDVVAARTANLFVEQSACTRTAPTVHGRRGEPASRVRCGRAGPLDYLSPSPRPSRAAACRDIGGWFGSP